MLNSCSSTWTTQNGVNGRKFVGPNGGTIFLPAAGCRWDSGRDYAGTYGYYWSSILYGSGPYYACLLDFNSGDAGWLGSGRFDGCTVRPVR